MAILTRRPPFQVLSAVQFALYWRSLNYMIGIKIIVGKTFALWLEGVETVTVIANAFIRRPPLSRCSVSRTQEKKNLHAGLYCSYRSSQERLWETNAIRAAEFTELVIDSTLSGFGDGIDNISDLNRHQRHCCGCQEVDTVFEHVFALWFSDLDRRP